MDLEEVVIFVLVIHRVRRLGKIRHCLISIGHQTDTDEIIQSKINEIGVVYPLLGAAFDRIHHMNIQELVISTAAEHTLLSIKNSSPKRYVLTHRLGVSCRLEYVDENIERVSMMACSIPYPGIMYEGNIVWN